MSHDANSDLETVKKLLDNRDQQQLERLLEEFRPRLRKMVAARIDPRLATRIDPSDVVQETMLEAIQKLPEYVREQPLPLYPWLRQLASRRMARFREQHIDAQRRSVNREQRYALGVSDESVQLLVDQLAAADTAPSQRAMRQELHQQLRLALSGLAEVDREVLLLQFVEQLSAIETAQILGISAEAVGMRRLRALRRLSKALSP